MNKGFRIEKRRIGKAVVYMVLILLALYTLFPLLILVTIPLSLIRTLLPIL